MHTFSRELWCRFQFGRLLPHEVAVGEAGFYHGDDVVVGEAGVGADADHVVDDEFDGGIGYRVRPQVVAFGHEGALPFRVVM